MGKITIPSPEAIEKNPEESGLRVGGKAPRLHEGWQAVAVNKISVYKKYAEDDIKKTGEPIRETLMVEVENGDGEQGVLWLSDDTRDAPKWVMMWKIFGIGWEDEATLDEIAKLWQPITDKVMAVKAEFIKGDRSNIIDLCAKKDMPDDEEEAPAKSTEKKSSAKEALKKDAEKKKSKADRLKDTI